MTNAVCAKCRNSLGTGSKKCFTCEHYPELLKYKKLSLCPICKGKTVGFEGVGENTQVYICPKISCTEFHHKADETINLEIKERQKEILLSGISVN